MQAIGFGIGPGGADEVEIAPTLDARAKDGPIRNQLGLAIGFGGNRQSGEIDVATAVNAHGGPHGRLDFESETFIAHSLRADGFDASEDGTGRGTPLIAFQSSQSGIREVEAHATLDANMGSRRQNGVMSFKWAQIGKPYDRTRYTDDQAGTLSAYDPEAIASPMSVRRLTPRECERLQGFPDDWTAITYRSKPAADGPRYRALGNSMAVPVLRWILRRVVEVDRITAASAVGALPAPADG